jgi:hypothetical protein
VDEILGDGATAARRLARETMREVHERMGFLRATDIQSRPAGARHS